MPVLANAAALSAAAALLHALPAARQAADEAPRSQTVVYLSLGALIGVLYSLGTEKFMRAMQHRHIFVRNAMLWLAAITWLHAAAAVAVVASLIYRQSGGGLEGYDRVLGVLLPFVVRADLVVDWAKRVAWALLHMSNWTQAAVQARRLLVRANNMPALVRVDDDVVAMTNTCSTPQQDLQQSEDLVWNADTNSLVRVADILQHFEKLSRIAAYSTAGLILAIPLSVLAMFYAAYLAVVAIRCAHAAEACLYLASIFLAPLAGAILLVASAGMLCGVVALSILGTIIQFAVYWSTRAVYTIVRIAVSHTWARFPYFSKSRAVTNVDKSSSNHPTGSFAVRARRCPEEAGAAIAQMGALLPTELEFALASWDGFHKGDKFRPEWFSKRVLQDLHFTLFEDGDSTLNGEIRVRPKRYKLPAKITTNTQTVAPSLRREEPAGVTQPPEISHFEEEPPSRQSIQSLEDARKIGVKDDDPALVLLERLGLDLSVRSTRRRRLSTYYAMAMLVSLQVESGGTAWRLQTIHALSEEEIHEKMNTFESSVVEEAKVALHELVSRLSGTSKYRIIPTGPPKNTVVPVQVWLRTALLCFLECPTSNEDGFNRQESHMDIAAT